MHCHKDREREWREKDETLNNKGLFLFSFFSFYYFDFKNSIFLHFFCYISAPTRFFFLLFFFGLKTFLSTKKSHLQKFQTQKPPSLSTGITPLFSLFLSLSLSLLFFSFIWSFSIRKPTNFDPETNTLIHCNCVGRNADGEWDEHLQVLASSRKRGGVSSWHRSACTKFGKEVM